MSKSGTQPDKVLTLLAVCGIIGPIMYTIVLIVLGLIRPNYNFVAQSMSELGAVGTPNAIIMNTVGLALFGVLIIAFAFGLHRGINEGRGSKIGPVLMAVAGAGFVGVGVFSCDPGCVAVSFTGHMHGVAAGILTFAMIFAPLVTSRRFRGNNLWKGYRSYSLATVAVAAIIGAMMGFTFFESWRGALQRLSLGVLMLWIEIIAIKLLRLSI